MYKLDLHTHSVASRDGGIKSDQYIHALDKKVIDCVAITDHNRIDLAQELQKHLGEKVIVGEEITTPAGEICGLFLTKVVRPGQTPLETVQAIKTQGGLVYIPHPFETVRSGITETALSEIADYVDIIEVHNGRAVFQNRGPQAVSWAKLNHKIRAASSDAHGLKGLGSTYTSVDQIPTKENFLEVLGRGHLITNPPPLITLLYPKANRLRKKLGRR